MPISAILARSLRILESATAKRRGILALYIRKSFGDSDDTYGYRRVHADLVAWGVQAGPELVRSLMRELGLEPCQPRPWRVSLTEGDGQEHDIPDLVNRDFTADAPGEKMVGDITYIPTWEGWLFLATVIDCHTKAVIGWAADDNYKTPLIEKAIEMAARNYPLAENAVFHSDRGSNYTSAHHAAKGVMADEKLLARQSRRFYSPSLLPEAQVADQPAAPGHGVSSPSSAAAPRGGRGGL